ncbi:hypothetical protein [Saccharothrix xinjiangensis]|uniref:Phage protein n=1 Tax=Saccharothrix xinjiangensis TaxID=204798 RepID=A0ABV9XWA7_9PSEU
MIGIDGMKPPTKRPGWGGYPNRAKRDSTGGYPRVLRAELDGRAVLWDRATIAPGRGKPQFARIHVHRQRRAMRKLLCQVCGHPADRDEGGVLWLLPDRTGRPPGWPEGILVSEPPVCAPCLTLAIRTCPALREEGHLVIRTGSCPTYGVEGFRYRAGPQGRPVPVERELVPFADPAVLWTLASELVRELLDCTVLEVAAGRPARDAR